MLLLLLWSYSGTCTLVCSWSISVYQTYKYKPPLTPFKKILHDIIKQALILRKFQTGKINVLSSLKPQNYHIVYVLLCLCCTLFLYLNADVILFCFMLPLFALASVMWHNLIVCSPELLLQHFKIAGLQVLRSTADVVQTWFLKGRISLSLNSSKKAFRTRKFGSYTI